MKYVKQPGLATTHTSLLLFNRSHAVAFPLIDNCIDVNDDDDDDDDDGIDGTADNGTADNDIDCTFDMMI